jgi:signal transduction histidine kinase
MRGACIQVSLANGSRAAAQIEPRDFDDVVGNLLDNACKWARTRVTVSAAEEGRWVRITVEDDGPRLPEAERERVIARGRKLDDRASGAGFGLAIVQDIVAAYDGSVRLETADSGGFGECFFCSALERRLRAVQPAFRDVMHSSRRTASLRQLPPSGVTI